MIKPPSSFRLSAATLSAAFAAGSLLSGAGWSQQSSPPADAAALTPPINHESGTIDEVVTAEDNGYRMRGYIVHWRDSRIFVAGSPEEPRQAGDSVDFKVYRSTANAHNALRFSTSQTDPDANVAADESKNARVSVTAGTSKVDDVLLADSDGFHFKAYTVMWHDARVVVVDPLLHKTHAAGDQINFKVLHSGASDNQQLAFALEE